MSAGPVTRRMSLPFLLGLLGAPAITCWLLLRSECGRDLRRTVFAYTGVMTAAGVLGRTLG